MSAEHRLPNVSRETLDALEAFEALVRHWTQRINLVSKASLEGLWTRHILDSLQLIPFLPEGEGHWLDLGSGGGFPGIVLSIAAKTMQPEMAMTLVESDTRKSVFLRTAIREFGLNAKVRSCRIETLPQIPSDIVSARALASLSTLLGYAQPHLGPGGKAVFLKGTTWKKELADAQREWSFSHEITTSETDPSAVILSIGNLVHV
ncbi:16S rRNA m(7)G-527 methyltransferase [Roseivivax lentus]|uniref:Ribosomal RNA small subunit methyltransferase G n=1 Tax=Roseivivax lentus TaxID=633194 RepID=A0A1N7JPH4_9RHOB|nr:16S rRNA (guanine(527)-N(7))-methyltransferase RsmG [Roseivivax lentus]SIS51144.1 16S rRNA m(7)G-527 methyltransferase [Roseivivax lentus]